MWLFKEAFKALASLHDLATAKDGAEAILRLQDHDATKLPDLVLLDINMPKVDGFEVLTYIRGDARLCMLPVIILSSSRDERDIRRAHELGANSYLCKTTDDFSDLVGDFSRYWLNRAELPQIELATD